MIYEVKQAKKMKAKIFVYTARYQFTREYIDKLSQKLRQEVSLIGKNDRIPLYYLSAYYEDVLRLVKYILKHKKNLLILTEYIMQLNKIYEVLKQHIKLPIIILD